MGVIIKAAMRLDNFCIDNDGEINGVDDFQQFEKILRGMHSHSCGEMPQLYEEQKAYTGGQ